MKLCRMITIDSSTNATALATFDNGQYKKVNLINCTKEKNMEKRFRDMATQIYQRLEEEKPYIIYMEETVVPRNAATQRFLTRLQGVAYAYCMLNDCEFNTLRPTEWRKLVGIEQGKKNREELKEEAVNLVKTMYGLEVTDDEAEAILIGVAVINRFEMIKTKKSRD